MIIAILLAMPVLWERTPELMPKLTILWYIIALSTARDTFILTNVRTLRRYG